MVAVLVLLMLALVVGVAVLAFGGWTGGQTIRRRVIIERDPMVEPPVTYARPVRRRVIEEDVRQDW
jgi:hypothetical protein